MFDGEGKGFNLKLTKKYVGLTRLVKFYGLKFELQYITLILLNSIFNDSHYTLVDFKDREHTFEATFEFWQNCK